MLLLLTSCASTSYIRLTHLSLLSPSSASRQLLRRSEPPNAGGGGSCWDCSLAAASSLALSTPAWIREEEQVIYLRLFSPCLFSVSLAWLTCMDDWHGLPEWPAEPSAVHQAWLSGPPIEPEGCGLLSGWRWQVGSKAPS